MRRSVPALTRGGDRLARGTPPHCLHTHTEADLADSIKGKIQDTGRAAKRAGEKVQEGAEVVSDKASDAAKATGKAVKDAGQGIKDKA